MNFDAAAIPAELRGLDQWVLWRPEVRDGKTTKVPFTVADPGRRASSTDPATWAPFDLAADQAEQLDLGIGFVFTGGDPYCGVDLDAGMTPADRGAIMVTLDSYSETSVSGNGAHVIVRATLNGHARNRKGPLEVYDQGRYFVVTGKHVVGTPVTIEDRQAELEEVLAHFLPRRDVSRRAAPQPVGIDDRELLDLAFAARNGHRIEALWNGDLAEHGGDHSAADLALCGHLAFWTGRDPARIDTMFRASGLMREKWERDDYRARTIDAAIAGTTDVYTPPVVRDVSRISGDAASVVTSASVTSEAEDVPVHTWYALDVFQLAADKPAPPEIAELFYTGRRNLLSGESEAGKSWLLLAGAAAELAAGRGVVWVDTDEMGATFVLERLQALGATDDAIRRLFAYLRPEEPLEKISRDYVLELLAGRNARLLVVDAFNSALTLNRLDAKVSNDIDVFYRALADPFRREGVAFVAADHVVKNKELRGAYSYGSERKHSGADVHIGMTKVDAFGRGRTGKAKLTVHKDRPGFLTRPAAGLFVLASNPDTGACSWRIDEDASVGEQGEFRPTGLMERVSRYLELAGDVRSRNQIEEGVKGNATYIRQAVDALTREGYTTETEGARGARLVRLERVFREDAEDDE